jgi:hypothetical protein
MSDVPSPLKSPVGGASAPEGPVNRPIAVAAAIADKNAFDRAILLHDPVGDIAAAVLEQDVADPGAGEVVADPVVRRGGEIIVEISPMREFKAWAPADVPAVSRISTPGESVVPGKGHRRRLG